MRAVWSFWTEPFREVKRHSWRSPLHHMLAWGLSLRVARKHFPETMLVTDTPGKALLVDSLGLSFTHVTTELDELRRCDPNWWTLGKLFAYRTQQQPFVHIDADVFLWKPLPAGLLSAPVFAQCPEQHPPMDTWFRPQQVELAFSQHGLCVPPEWEWSSSRSPHCFREANCGIIGGNRIDFIQYYASLAIDLILNSDYTPAWRNLSDLTGYNILVEQFLLDACYEYHRFNPQSPFRGIHMAYLFPTQNEAFSQEAAGRAGYTHLLGDSKRDAYVSRRLEERTRQEDANFYRHCLEMSRYHDGLTGHAQ